MGQALEMEQSLTNLSNSSKSLSFQKKVISHVLLIAPDIKENTLILQFKMFKSTNHYLNSRHNYENFFLSFFNDCSNDNDGM